MRQAKSPPSPNTTTPNCAPSTTHRYIDSNTWDPPARQKYLKLCDMRGARITTPFHLFVELVFSRWVQDRDAHPAVRIHCTTANEAADTQRR